MKDFIKSLRNGKIDRLLFFESVKFAFAREPESYGEYLRRSVEYAEEYSMDAIPLTLKFGKEITAPDQAIRELSRINTPLSLGLVYSAPFTRTAREIGPTRFFLELHENPEIKNRILLNTKRACETARIFDGFADFIILIDPMSCNDLISPNYFREHVYPSYKLISQASSLPSVVHLPGRIRKNLPHIIDSGINGLQPIDKDVLDTIVQESQSKIYIIGNINRKLLIKGDYDSIHNEFMRCVNAHGFNPFIVHTDFWIPSKADPERVRILSDLIKDYNN